MTARIARALLRSERGAALIEAAIIFPIAVLVLCGTVEYGVRVYNAMALESAARAGAQYAVANPDDLSGIQAAVSNATRLTASTLTVTASQSCVCSGGAALENCSATCSSGQFKIKYVTVNVTQPYVSVVPYAPLARPAQLSGSAYLRIP